MEDDENLLEGKEDAAEMESNDNDEGNRYPLKIMFS